MCNLGSNNGELIVTFLDKNSLPGKIMDGDKVRSRFFKPIYLHSISDGVCMIESNGFAIVLIIQTQANACM